MALLADRAQVLAYRLRRHNLARRLPPGSLLEAAKCGVQNTPPGSAALALRARVQDLKPAEVDRALAADRTLVQIRSLRTAPYIFPTVDAPIFTAGLLPEDEASLRFFIQGAVPSLDEVGLSGTELVERTGKELLAALDGRVLSFRNLSADLTERVARSLSQSQVAVWQSPSWYGPNHCLGEALVHFALYIVALEGLVCFAPREGDEASFVRLDQWLGRPLPRMKPEEARAALVRRYLRYYGPSTVGHFAEWAGISPAAAGRSWALVAPMLVEASVGGRRAWLHQDDLADFASPPVATGVRLLPPGDPYLAQRDRETLIADTALRRRVWRIQGNPGVVLADGEIVALWRPQKRGKRLVVSVEPFTSLPASARADVAAEAHAMAVFRECTEAETRFAS